MESNLRRVDVPKPLVESLFIIYEQLIENRDAVLSRSGDLIQELCVIGGYEKRTQHFHFKYKVPGKGSQWIFNIDERDLVRIANGTLQQIDVEEIFEGSPGRDPQAVRVEQRGAGHRRGVQPRSATPVRRHEPHFPE